MPNSSLTFCFLLFDGFSNMVLASALEPLRAARDLATGPDIRWSISTLTDQSVRSSSGISVSPGAKCAEIGKVDYLVLVSGYGMRAHATGSALAKIRRLGNSARHVVGIDAGAWLMAAAGFLDGLKATIHWQEFDAFSEAFPEVRLSENRFVSGGRFITCGGASTAMDMMLDLIHKRFGPAVAFDVSNLFVYDAVRQSEQNRGAARQKSTGSPALRQAVNTMVENIEHPISLATIAKINATSVRSLNRLFSRELRLTPGKYYQVLRLTRARDMAVQTSLSISQIALRCGFSSGASLSHAFSAHYGMALSSLRKPRAAQ